MAKPLLSLLHISDLHIGKIDPVSGNAAVSPAGAALFANFSWFDGVLGHHARALQDLHAFYWKMVDDGEAPQVIMTGDLTRIGHSDDFTAGSEYLAREIDLNPPQDNSWGLFCPDWKDYAIPGNHDHWSGRPFVWGGPTTAFNACFPAGSLPFIKSITLSNGRELQLAGINTDAGVWPYGQKRLRAVGSFQNQLTALAPKLRKRQDQQIRMLLMHHSWYKRGLVLSIDRGSRAALDQFLVDHGIQVILTGHTHRACLRPFVPNVPNAAPVNECRSGTTTQADQVPYSWRNLLGQFPIRKWPDNTLIVHQLFDDNGTTKWHAEVFVRDTTQGFVTTGPQGQREWVV